MIPKILVIYLCCAFLSVVNCKGYDDDVYGPPPDYSDETDQVPDENTEETGITEPPVGPPPRPPSWKPSPPSPCETPSPSKPSPVIQCKPSQPSGKPPPSNGSPSSCCARRTNARGDLMSRDVHYNGKKGNDANCQGGKPEVRWLTHAVSKTPIKGVPSGIRPPKSGRSHKAPTQSPSVSVRKAKPKAPVSSKKSPKATQKRPGKQGRGFSNMKKHPINNSSVAAKRKGRRFLTSSLTSLKDKYPALPPPECFHLKGTSLKTKKRMQYISFYIKGEVSRNCVDVLAPGLVQENDCGKTNVKWDIGVPQWAPDSTWVTMSLQDGDKSLCLGRLESNNVEINATVCQDQDAKQLWKVEPLGHASNAARIVENSSCRCLTGQTNEKTVWLEECRNGYPEQLWQMVVESFV